MRWLIINTDYDDFIDTLYTAQPDLAEQSYEQQWRARVRTGFGLSDCYSHFLRALGHDAIEIVPNHGPLQTAWARENGLRVTTHHWRWRRRRGLVPWPRRCANPEWLRDVLAAQVRAYRPDILYSMAVDVVDRGFLARVRDSYRLAVAQHASMIPPVDMSGYDLLLSSLPNLVEHFLAHGLRSEYFRLAFDPRVLAELNGTPQTHDVVFVGGLSGIQHDPGARLLEQLCERLDVQIWGYGADGLPNRSPIRSRCRGPLWGHDMYRAFRAARIVLNRHGPIALGYANNMRLYEATGVGRLLLTEHKQNLPELFEPGREVVTYRSAAECAELAGYYLAHPAEREAIARAGQQRTLREHTYAHRMRELVEIVGRYL